MKTETQLSIVEPELQDRTVLERRAFLRRAITIGWSTPMIWSVLQSPAFANHNTPCSASTSCGTASQHCVTSVARNVCACKQTTCDVTCSNRCCYPAGTVLNAATDCPLCCTGNCGTGTGQATNTCI